MSIRVSDFFVGHKARQAVGPTTPITGANTSADFFGAFGAVAEPWAFLGVAYAVCMMAAVT